MKSKCQLPLVKPNTSSSKYRSQLFFIFPTVSSTCRCYLSQSELNQ